MGPFEDEYTIKEYKKDVIDHYKKDPVKKEEATQEVKIDPKVILALQLDVPNTRMKRREIARKARVPWKLYRKLEMLVTYRKQKGLKLDTGENK